MLIRRSHRGTEYFAKAPYMVLRVVDEGAPGPPVEAVVKMKDFRDACSDKNAVLEWGENGPALDSPPSPSVGGFPIYQERCRYAPDDFWKESAPESCWQDEPPQLDDWEEFTKSVALASEDDSRPILCGAFLSTKGKGYPGEMITTDSYTLGVSTPPVPLGDVQAVIPAKAMTLFTKAARKQAGRTTKKNPVSPAVEFGVERDELDPNSESDMQLAEDPRYALPGLATMTCGNVSLQTTLLPRHLPEHRRPRPAGLC